MQTANNLCALVATHFKPPKKMTVSEWADKYRKLSSESSALPGQWRTSVVEYMREPMDCVGDPRVREVVVMAAAQVGKSEFLNNTVGFIIDHDPSPILMVQPTIESAEDYSKDRIAPMLRDTPVLRKKVADEKSRTSGNTIKNKKFPGGYLVMVGANAPSGLASRPIRAVFADEIDRAPVSAGEEGDPIDLAVKRTTTFWNRIILKVSTPTNKDASRIEASYLAGDQRVYEVPCPDCGEFQDLKWSNVKWTDRDPDTAEYMCDHCGSLWSDTQRVRAMRKGKWVARQEFKGVASFLVTGLLSPFATMADGVREFLAAQGDPAKLKVWTNTYLGETWEEQGRKLDGHALYESREEYDTFVPEGVSVLTMAVDVQDDRLEYEIIGWGDDYESWSIDHGAIYGDLSTSKPWTEIDEIRKQIYDHPIFGDMVVRRTCVDSGGHYTQAVYDYVRGKEPDVYAIKGKGGDGVPLIGKPSRANIGKIPLVTIGTMTAKEIVFTRLSAQEGEAGYCHFPKRYSEEYFNQLTAEKLVTRYHKGYKKQEYQKTRARNEALDLRVYATAALELANVNLNAWRRMLESKLDKKVEPKETEPKQKPLSRRRTPARKKSAFVTAWRDF